MPKSSTFAAMIIRTYTHIQLLSIFIVLLFTNACRKQVDDIVVIEPDPIDVIIDGCPGPLLQESHLVLGNPSNAVSDLDVPNNYLIHLPQYALSYNRDKGIPNWVAWHLDTEWFGDAPRQNDFRGYWDLPVDWFYVTTSDYTNTGFNRGHCCPSADRKCSEDFNSETFYMLNVIPQAPQHNQEPWRILEEYCRDLVYQGNELYILMGHYGIGGVGDFGYAETFADGNITVPASIWKVIVVLPKGNDDLNRVADETRVIAVDIENTDQLLDTRWYNYRTSIDDIEAKTGLDILSNLPISIQENLEAQMDMVEI